MDSFFQTLKNLGPMRLAAMGIVAISLLGFFTFMTSRMTSSQMSLLYSDLDSQDSAAIGKKLEAMKIPFEIAPDGKTIKVASDMVGKARMAAAGEGLPRGGSIGYEIFDQKEGFGTTSFVQNINHLRALEGELARTISTLGSVTSARVHLVLPQRELFSRTETHATASVFLRVRAGGLSQPQVSAIQNLISAAVPQLRTDQISIVDDKGNLLAKPKTGDETAAGGANQDEMRLNYEQAQARKIEDLLNQSVGFGKVRAKVSAEMDFDRITTQSEIFDPDSQVVRSQQTVSEASKNAEGSNNNAVSVQNNLPAGIEQSTPGGSGASNSNDRTEETLNYEINKTVRNQVREAGQVRRLSVAVVVDGHYETDKDGKQTYQARSAEEMEQLKALVRSAVNFDATRGDSVEVINMKFQQAEAPPEQPLIDMMFGVPKEDLFHLVEIVVMAGIGVLVLLLVVRPLLNRVLESANNAGAGGGGENAALQGGGMAQLSAPGGGSSLLASGNDEGDSALEQMIDIGRVEGRVKASSLRKIGEIIEKHPEESVSILRNWIYQETR